MLRYYVARLLFYSIMLNIDKLYNKYFSYYGKRWFRTCVIVFIMLIVLFLMINADNIFINKNLYFYTYSTIVQGFLALVAFLGAIVIYKLQLIEMDLNKMRDRVIPSLRFFLGTTADTLSWFEAMNEARKIMGQKQKENWQKENANIIKIYYRKMKKISREKRAIRSKMVYFSFVSFINIGIALISLLFTEIFAGFYYIGGIMLIDNIFLSMISLLLAFNVINVTLGPFILET